MLIIAQECHCSSVQPNSNSIEENELNKGRRDNVKHMDTFFSPRAQAFALDSSQLLLHEKILVNLDRSLLKRYDPAIL
uniref:Uncharacterized protein n=1 Tax=Rhizophora mucronata TaxID=61149 RepID=A0A2P2NQ38_RHIMU